MEHCVHGFASLLPVQLQAGKTATGTFGRVRRHRWIDASLRGSPLVGQPLDHASSDLPDPLLAFFWDHGWCSGSGSLLGRRPQAVTRSEWRLTLVLTVSAPERELTTVKGLARAGVLGNLQRAFLEKSALQCDIRIPGFLVNATALLRQNPNPTEEEVSFWLQGNLCRCTGNTKIFEAVLDAARKATENAPGELVSVAG